MLKNKIAVVTGATRGLGRAIAKSFAKNGASLVLVATNSELLNQVARELETSETSVIAISGDVAQKRMAQKIVNSALNRFGTIDILVNAAGIISRTPFEEMKDEDYFDVIATNLHGPMFLCKETLQVMKKNKSGKIINLTSQMARLPHPNAAVSYEISKSGLAALTRHLALHFAEFNICINSIAPGSIETEMLKTMDPGSRDDLLKKIPMKKLGQPQDVASCALFLASEMSDYITGETINVNGGSWME